MDEARVAEVVWGALTELVPELERAALTIRMLGTHAEWECVLEAAGTETSTAWDESAVPDAVRAAMWQWRHLSVAAGEAWFEMRLVVTEQKYQVGYDEVAPPAWSTPLSAEQEQQLMAEEIARYPYIRRAGWYVDTNGMHAS